MEMRLCIDGRPVEPGELGVLATVNYGHFTAMQVRGGRIRGLEAHLRRVDAAHRELFGHGLERSRVREQWARAVADQQDASLRATFYDDSAGETHVVIVLRDLVEPDTAPQSLQSVRWVRPFAHLKHVGTFAQIRYGEQAEHAGFYDALLVDDGGHVAETTMANVGFLRDDRLVWPTGPILLGIEQQLLTDAAIDAGLRTENAPVPLAELDAFDAAFTVNSVGVVPIGRIDDHHFASSESRVRPIVELHDSLGWDALGG